MVSGDMTPQNLDPSSTAFLTHDLADAFGDLTA
jgi:hypothetical protein